MSGPDLNLDDNGQETTPPKETTPPGDNVTVSREEFDAMRRQISDFERRMTTAYNPNPPPQKSQGPSYDDRINAIESEIEKIDNQIAKKAEDGEPWNDLMKKRSKLDRQITRLEIQRDEIDPFKQAGMNTLNQITDKISRPDMKYYDVVKDDYQQILNENLTDSQRADPGLRQQAYLLAVGRNQDKIIQMEIEKSNRTTAASAPDSTGAGRNQKKTATYEGHEIPNWSDLHSKGALKALKEKGITPDEEYKRRGYKGGWADYYLKHKHRYDEEVA